MDGLTDEGTSDGRYLIVKAMFLCQPRDMKASQLIVLTLYSIMQYSDHYIIF